MTAIMAAMTTLPSGVRYLTDCDRPIAVGGLPGGYRESVNGIWVDCTGCGRRDRIAGEWGGTDRTPDITGETAHAVFIGKGWTVRPTLCPTCNLGHGNE